MLFLPENATQMIHTLDVFIFNPLNMSLKKEMEKFMIKKAVTSLSKKDTIEISSKAQKKGIINNPRNIFSIFKTCGLWSVSFLAIQQCWSLHRGGGIDSSYVVL